MSSEHLDHLNRRLSPGGDEVGQAVKPCPYGDDLPGIRRFQTKKGDFEDVSAPRSPAVVQNLRPLNSVAFACSSQVTRSLREQSGYGFGTLDFVPQTSSE